MRRRDIALGLAGLASLSVLPFGRLRAHSPDKLPKLALLLPDAPDDLRTPANVVPGPRILLAALAELGYVDGQNIRFEFGFASHALERLPALAAELVAAQPDVLYTYTTGGLRAAAAATSTIPIVVAPVAEETMAALVPDFAQPPRNITGLTLTSREQREKCLQLFKEAVPRIRRVGVLFNPLNPIWRGYPEVMNDTARALGIELVRVEAHGVNDVDEALTAAMAEGVDAIYGLPESTLTGSDRTLRRIVQLLESLHLPAASDDVFFARAGGLLSLGMDEPAVYPGAAQYIDRILKGAKVAELPVVLPSKFVLTVNLRTAEALGIMIPPAILLRADEVIE
jgi:putative tryptophan/tyrosine transport system substrate-binding protein